MRDLNQYARVFTFFFVCLANLCLRKQNSYSLYTQRNNIWIIHHCSNIINSIREFLLCRSTCSKSTEKLPKRVRSPSSRAGIWPKGYNMKRTEENQNQVRWDQIRSRPIDSIRIRTCISIHIDDQYIYIYIYLTFLARKLGCLCSPAIRLTATSSKSWPFS